MDMLNWLAKWMHNDNTKIVYILALILIANLIDFVFGWLNAKFNPKIKFSSGKAIYGIARKMVLFIILIYFIPVAMLIPDPIGLSALYVLFLGYLASELNSILSHLKATDDDGKVDVFAEFVKTIFNHGKRVE
jgi:toxin secretion/phage lysis holin